ncbi:MAG: phosphoglucosamine mutase [Actinomycetota bacterium]|nr:phosphoglucosamine mutase [Actinomycetota bacterium]
MAPRFGTDGIRGAANAELTPELVLALGRAVVKVLGPPQCLVGRDTRRSGAMLSASLSAGLASEGVDVVDVGVAPTPAVAHLSQALGVPGLVVSASHNPFADNGVKVFAAGGLKLDTSREAEIEAHLEALSGVSPEAEPVQRRSGAGVGDIAEGGNLLERYQDHLFGALEGRSLAGLSIVLDCANGAAARVAAEVFRRTGATVTVVADEPDGLNINTRCGSTNPELMSEAVRAGGADIGLAFDGDADRLLAVDAAGRLVDGDHLISLFARDLAARGVLKNSAVAVTVMTNLGFHRAMDQAGIKVVQTPVGDRNVLDAIELNGLVLGGEQSGHIIFRELATTGDGLLTGLLLADLVCRSGSPLSVLAAGAMTRLPQCLLNVRVEGAPELDRCSAVWDAVAAAEVELGADGRVLLRASGTEPVVRVMVEAPTDEAARRTASRIAALVESHLG